MADSVRTMDSLGTSSARPDEPRTGRRTSLENEPAEPCRTSATFPRKRKLPAPLPLGNTDDKRCMNGPEGLLRGTASNSGSTKRNRERELLAPPSPVVQRQPFLHIAEQPVSEHIRKLTLRATVWVAVLLLLVVFAGADESTAQLASDIGNAPHPSAPHARALRQVLPTDPDIFEDYPDITTPSCPNYNFSQSALCGPQHGGQRCRAGYCCSAWGYCGNSEEWCEFSFGLQCQLGYGRCWFNETVFCVDGPTLSPQTRTRTGTTSTSVFTTGTGSLTATRTPGPANTTSLTTTKAVTTDAATTTLPTTKSTILTPTVLSSSFIPSSTTARSSSFAPSTAPLPTTQTLTPTTQSASSTRTTVTFPSEFVDASCAPYYEDPPATRRSFIKRLLFPRAEGDLPPEDACILPNPPSRDGVDAQSTAQNYGTYAAVGAGVVGAAAAAAWGGGEIWSRRKKAAGAVV